jgi:hydrogenase maturation protein HypF
MCSKPPPAADIKAINVIEETAITAISLNEFNIRYSENTTAARVTVPADLAICSECHEEILDPGNRRYHHPFTTCVKCGPRYTIIKQLPYDRKYTTMASFPLCSKCHEEYTNPADRRFHAETIACPECGPQLWLADANGQKLPNVNPLQAAAEAIRNGAIVAVRGIGGFQLLADAFNRNTIAELRRRKNRPDKPFALMADCLATVRRHSITSGAGETLLESSAAPAVIFPVNEENHELPVDLISPDTATLGWMLPYSPLHLLLFQNNIRPVLIATSGNHGGEPIALSNQEAIDALHGIAGLYLFHDREIMLRNDDSVAVVMAGQTQLWRRARGYSPQPVTVNCLAETPQLLLAAPI